MSILDNVEKIRAADPGNMYNAIFDMAEHIQEAMKIGRQWEINPEEFTEIKNIVLIGMGGSAIGGDLLRSILSDKLLIPFSIVRNYTLPEYVDDETLVLASSYSGNTEETLAALDDAIDRKAMIAGFTTGGMMAEVCNLNEIPWVQIPEGLQPRAALGYSFVPVLIFLERIGLVKDVSKELDAVISSLQAQRENYFEDIDVEKNPAKLLAEQMHNKIPIIYGGPTLTDVVSVRWKGQICENSKMLAFANQFAEFNHNELVGWHKKNMGPLLDKLMVVHLRDEADHPKIEKRMNIVKELIEDIGVPVFDIQASGETAMVRIFNLIQLGDFISYYLAVLNKVDPTPVEVIQKLKKMLVE